MQKNFLSHLKSYTDTEIGGIKDRKGCVIMSERNILENQTMNETKVNHKYYLGEPMVIVDPEGTNHKVIIDEEGYFVDFPGIEQGRWTIYLERPVKFDGSERNEFGVVLLRHEDGFRCFWTIQTDDIGQMMMDLVQKMILKLFFMLIWITKAILQVHSVYIKLMENQRRSFLSEM